MQDAIRFFRKETDTGVKMIEDTKIPKGFTTCKEIIFEDGLDASETLVMKKSIYDKRVKNVLFQLQLLQCDKLDYHQLQIDRIREILNGDFDE